MPRLRLLCVLAIIGVSIRPSRDPAAAEPARQEDGTRTDWLAAASERLGQAEYDITVQTRSVLPNHPGGLEAANRRQDLRAYFLADGIDIVRRTEALPTWSLHLSLLEAGTRADRHPVEWAAPEAAGRVALYRRGDLLERWENTERGILLRLELPGVDEGERGEALLDLDTSMDLILSADGAEAGFYHDGVRVVRLALSSPSDARLEKTGGRIALSYTGTGSALSSQITLALTGPGASLTGRGLSTTPDWITDGNQAGSSYGFSTATAGDVNGDGYSDVLVGAKDYDNGQTDEGRAFLFLGSSTGLSMTPAWSNEGNQAGAKYGISVSTAGDVNGDGYSDVIVGAQNWAATGKPDAGKAYLYLGSSTGLSASPVWTVEGDQTDAWLGDWVADAGDVNGDGLSDVIIGAYRYDNGQFNEGRAYVYLGTTAGTGLALTPNWFAESDNDGAEFGQSVATAGDVNGDGYSDVLVGAVQYTNGLNNQGRAYVFLGSPAGVAKNPAWTYKGDQASAFLGFSVGTAGDVNGDGYSDVIVGADMYDNGQNNEGRAYLFLGSATGPSLSPSWFVESNQATAILGKQVTTAGDVNGDGYSDVIVGVRNWTNSQTQEGSVWIFLGSPTGPSTTPDWITFGGQPNARFGGACATAGDVNGDGFSDVIIGASLYDNNGQVDEGRAYVYLGSSKGLSSSPATSRESNQEGARLGISVAAAGDINGDGYSDLILGADSYDNGEADEGRAYLFLGSASGVASSPAWIAEGDQPGAHFGASVSQAGDVNGDGYGDVIVGAPGYDNGQTDEGRAYVYAGSITGLTTSPIWTAEGDQEGAQMGASVSLAGDLDRDGFGDIVVGAPGYDNGQVDEGRATIYPGSVSGPAISPAWAVEGNQDGAAFGYAVAAAGDVNRDGYADIIVGAPLFDNGEADEGRVSLYLGSPTGASTLPAWTAESNQAGARLGASVATAGDVNGDGYSDLLVGAPGFDSATSTDEGQALVYLGSASGPGAVAAWFSEDVQAGAQLGSSVSGAGDVNGDGYSDIIVGAPGYDNGQTDEGRALVYYGSASGISSPPAWTAESDQPAASFGASVAGAGDVNGDGYSDVLVGAPGFDNGQVDEGAIWVYVGNQRGGPPRIARQRRSDGSAPIAPGEKSDSSTGFRLAGLGRSPMGRSKVRLEREVKPLGVPFDGTGVVFGELLDTGTPTVSGSVVAMNESVSAQQPGVSLHWRMRLHTADTFFPRLPWFSMTGNGPAEADLTTAGCRDLDGDGYGSPPDASCLGGLVADCNDGNPAVYPGAPQTCDGVNNDCLAAGWPSLAGTNEVDDDGDGRSECAGDCDDASATTYPGAPQMCDGVNNDCFSPGWPSLAGTNEADGDGDSYSTCAGDCNDADATSWGTPSEATDLELTHDSSSGLTTFNWLVPASPGGTLLLYDMLRSPDPRDFVGSGECAESDGGPNTNFAESAVPPPDAVFYYLIRAQSGCTGSAGIGPLGFASDGTPRQGRACP